jgi:hypothetical protein
MLVLFLLYLCLISHSLPDPSWQKTSLAREREREREKGSEGAKVLEYSIERLVGRTKEWRDNRKEVKSEEIERCNKNSEGMTASTQIFLYQQTHNVTNKNECTKIVFRWKDARKKYTFLVLFIQNRRWKSAKNKWISWLGFLTHDSQRNPRDLNSWYKIKGLAMWTCFDSTYFRKYSDNLLFYLSSSRSMPILWSQKMLFPSYPFPHLMSEKLQNVLIFPIH